MTDKEENMCSNCPFQTIFRLIGGERTLAVVYKVLGKLTAILPTYRFLATYKLRLECLNNKFNEYYMRHYIYKKS